MVLTSWAGRHHPADCLVQAGAAEEHGAVLVQSLQDKETTCPEHGRWSDEAADFLWQLALSKRLAESLVEQGERDTVSDKGAPVARSERADTCDAQRVTSSISSSSSRGTTPKIRSHVGKRHKCGSAGGSSHAGSDRPWKQRMSVTQNCVVWRGDATLPELR